jgi:hypothetical protein
VISYKTNQQHFQGPACVLKKRIPWKLEIPTHKKKRITAATGVKKAVVSGG